ncbi:MAG: TRAFAC clade GTPase domain-containing protein [Thermoanaerobaculia bacterium]
MRFLCKDCWIAHDEDTLLARCKRCEANTRIQRFEPLSTKRGRGIARGPLVCKLHANEPLDIYCGECERDVPPRTIVGDRSVIAILGDTASGKTSYLWILSEQLRRGHDGIFIRQGLGDSDEQIAKAARMIFDRGRMSATEPTDADVRNYAWELALGDRGTTVIAFHDAAGEVWNELAGLSRTTYDRFYRYLDLVGSLMFAIDGAHVAASLEAEERKGIVPPQTRKAQTNELDIVDAVARRFRARGERVPIVAVITKADMLWDREEFAAFREDSGADAETIGKSVRELLIKSGRVALVRALEETFAPVTYFAISAFGHVISEPLRIEDVRPARVADPLLALLGNLVTRM